MGDHMSVLNRMVEKIATNLQRWGDSHTVTHKTLALFYELANSHSSTRLMLTSNSINLILANHTEAHFQFMAVPSNGRLRTLYYAILGRLLTFDDMKARWEAFMAPFDITWARLGAGLQEAVANPAKLNDPDLQRMAVGLFRDLRGIIDAALSPRAYNWFFDWIYPTHFPVIQRCMEVWWHNKKVTSPILKFLSELSYNKSQRLVFNPSSPNGILLFREASQLICMFGNNVMQPAYSAQVRLLVVFFFRFLFVLFIQFCIYYPFFIVIFLSLSRFFIYRLLSNTMTSSRACLRALMLFHIH